MKQLELITANELVWSCHLFILCAPTALTHSVLPCSVLAVMPQYSAASKQIQRVRNKFYTPALSRRPTKLFQHSSEFIKWMACRPKTEDNYNIPTAIYNTTSYAEVEQDTTKIERKQPRDIIVVIALFLCIGIRIQ